MKLSPGPKTSPTTTNASLSSPFWTTLLICALTTTVESLAFVAAWLPANALLKWVVLVFAVLAFGPLNLLLYKAASRGLRLRGQSSRLAIVLSAVLTVISISLLTIVTVAAGGMLADMTGIALLQPVIVLICATLSLMTWNYGRSVVRFL